MPEVGGHQVATKEEARRLLPRELTRLQENPFDCIALTNLANFYNVLEDDELAMGLAKRNVEVLPWAEAVACLNQALMFRQYGRHGDAWPYIERAHRIMPEDQFMGHVYAEELIRQGKWLEAWPLCAKYRMSKRWISPRNVQEWKGEDLKGKRLALICEGGRGDAFWLFRFIPTLRDMGAIITYLCLPDIGEFLQNHPWIEEPEGTVFQDEQHPYDYWVSVFELLLWLKVDKPYWPGVYLEAHKEYPLPSTDKLRVGICWECGEKIDVRKHRSLKNHQTAKLLDNHDVEWVSLQKGMKAPTSCLEPEITNWDDTAALIEACDLIVTVDTSVVHLAGAMGKPTWVILGGYQDCKWGTTDRSGWYPSVRIFRNNTFGFEYVVDVVNREITRWSRAKQDSACITTPMEVST